MAGRNTQPDNESGQARNIEQPCVRRIFTHQCRNESECADGGGGQHCVDRYAVTRHLCEEARRLPDECHRVQHSRGGVQARVSCGEDCGQNDGVHDRCCSGNTHTLEDQSEGRVGNVCSTVAQEVRIGVRNQRSDDDDCANIEEHDAPEHGLDCSRHVAARIRGFTCCNTDKFGSLEREACNHEDRNDGQESTVEGSISGGPVLNSRGVIEDSEDHQSA